VNIRCGYKHRESVGDALRKRLKNLFGRVAEGVCVSDDQGRVLYANSAARRMLDIGEGESDSCEQHCPLLDPGSEAKSAAFDGEYGPKTVYAWKESGPNRAEEWKSLRVRCLRVLLPALERHEEVENLLLGDSDYAAGGDARRILALVASQHKEIEALRVEVEALLKSAQRLELHFETEKNLFWPSCNNLSSRSIRRSLAHEAGEKVGEMEKSWAAISGYMKKHL